MLDSFAEKFGVLVKNPMQWEAFWGICESQWRNELVWEWISFKAKQIYCKNIKWKHLKLIFFLQLNMLIY